MYSFLNAAADRIHLDLDNWKDSPEVWVRRFKEKEDGSLPTSYEEIL